VNNLTAKRKAQLQSIYDRNPFVKLLQMEVIELHKGETVLSMPVHDEITNLWQTAHGGALAALVDTAMGVSCSSFGKLVTTLEMNINFIRGARCGETIKAFANVVHNGKSTLVAESEVKDSEGNLLAKARGTFFVVGQPKLD